MRQLIDTYRGYGIYFDTDNETFISQIDNNHTPKKSFAASKKLIDDYLKENAGFEAFSVHYSHDFNRTLLITGIRKDGRFVVKYNNGESGQLSEYDERGWYLIDPSNAGHYDRIAGLEKEIKDLENLIEGERDKIKVVTLKDAKLGILSPTMKH